MRALLLFGSLAVGALFFIYEFYKERNGDHEEMPHGYGGAPLSEEDIIDLDSVETSEVRRRIGHNRTLPGRDEVCSICLDMLIRRDADRRYCIISLPECGHWFHQKCAIRLLEYHPMCPVCRKNIDGAKLKGTPVRVLQASDININDTTTTTSLSHSNSATQHPVAGCSQSNTRRPHDYQSDSDLD